MPLTEMGTRGTTLGSREDRVFENSIILAISSSGPQILIFFAFCPSSGLDAPTVTLEAW